ncbi:MAG: sigma-70 family RNA polymerase sigma factor [Clostridiales bacterium]|nr:sigma-70 family RNA polymerase sigma factor [Clostridiales bacterium]
MKIKKDKIFFEQEVTSFYNYLLNFITTITNDRILAADIVQETMETAWKKLDTIRKYSSIKYGLKTIAKNKLMAYYRDNKIDLETVQLNDNIIPMKDEDVIKKIIEKEDRRQILLVISNLREEYILIIIMHYYYDISLKEVAEIFNTNYNTVVSWHHRALKKLSNLFDKYYKY